ncbi:hypothetical protein [Embleya hyalina]|uniref:Ig-like domain-containing protein n=1 Tax=Embleya hyalina TaxID=516124 RepID=A0A401YLV6_9ACTN|nr:hypothetical protein [Embleya hyalina]GCD95592.1 hypothetical protein EHYA_03267 [Embleya hyalina]
MSASSLSGPRTSKPRDARLDRRLFAAAACAVAVVGLAAPTAAAAPNAAAVANTKSLVVLWAEARPSSFPPNNGTLTIGGTYTCTVGGTVQVGFSSLQIMPTAMPSGAGFLPCGPGVVDAPWELTSLGTPDVHHGHVSVFPTFDGAGQLPVQLTA